MAPVELLVLAPRKSNFCPTHGNLGLVGRVGLWVVMRVVSKDVNTNTRGFALT